MGRLGDVVEVREAVEEQEVKESMQPENRVIRGLASSTRRPVLDWDERDGWVGVMLGGRKRIAPVDTGEADVFSTS